MKKVLRTRSAVINLGSVITLTMGGKGGGSEQKRYWGWDGMKNAKNSQELPINMQRKHITTLGTVKSLTLGRGGDIMERGRQNWDIIFAHHAFEINNK